MSTVEASNPSHTERAAQRRDVGARRISTETKTATKTTEFFGMVAVIIGILISAALVDGSDGGTDPFTAAQAWLYVSITAGAYFVGRGLAKSGSREVLPREDRG